MNEGQIGREEGKEADRVGPSCTLSVCLPVKRGRTKFKQDLSPVSAHWNKAADISHYRGHK